MARSTFHRSMQSVRERIDPHYFQPLDLNQLSQAANLSRYHFLRAFHMTLHEYLTRIRKNQEKKAHS